MAEKRMTSQSVLPRYLGSDLPASDAKPGRSRQVAPIYSPTTTRTYGSFLDLTYLMLEFSSSTDYLVVEAATLHDRIRYLEDFIQDQCPGMTLQGLSGLQSATALRRPRNDSGHHPERAKLPRTGVSNAISNPIIDNDHECLLSPDMNRTSPAAAIEPRTADDLAPGTTHNAEREIAHEIGLIPLSAGVSKYVGPSSGFSVARLVFAQAEKASPGIIQGIDSHGARKSTTPRFKFVVDATDLPKSLDQTLNLSRTYFEHVHNLYPFLHEPSHYQLIKDIYRDIDHSSPVDKFQVTMVLAISSIILCKRAPITYTGEGLSKTAMRYVDQIDFQSSVKGVQCLLLIAIFTLYSPFLGINPWYLNYQSLAVVLDLGLQRDVSVSESISPFEKEMRSRVFWVIYTIDRTLATALGRPIGLRDEACDLRLPDGTADDDFSSSSESLQISRNYPASSSPATCSIVIFRLAQLSSEIKYILHSVTTNVPRYTYPRIPDISLWQSDLEERLHSLYSEISQFSPRWGHLTKVCEIKYHEVVMLLFLPTPRIRTPTKRALMECYKSAERVIQLWHELYDSDWISYPWTTIHSLCLSSITILYSIWMVPEMSVSIKIDDFTSTMRASSNVLSAAGEHWAEARRSRKSLDGLIAATIRWLLDLRLNKHFENNGGVDIASSQVTQLHGTHYQAPGNVEDLPEFELPILDSYVSSEDFALFVGAPDPLSTNFSLSMEGLFKDYQPSFDFNLQ
ncbi:hypothetical protein LTR84_010253 [Exophiala bonariae]|uniref:Xylanolytic transcriptional activator regulatory domain-containing protein n=1 Tax=Exophiala bonariae TaxID=1690606 RepID=A0AAV9MW09_9EURO|nr:hypothetical protein LTR84_010253 [Exophiala bonariae]